MLSTHGYFDPVPDLGKTDTGGQVLYVLHLSRALVELGVQVDIITRWFDRSQKQIEPLPGCPDARVVRIPAGGWEFIPKERIYDVLPELAANTSRFIEEGGLDYDLFHGHYVDAGIVALDLAEALARPVFFTAHSLGAWKRQVMGGDPGEMDEKYNFTRRIGEERRIFKSVNAQTVTSEEEVEKIGELYSLSPENLTFIPPGVDVDLFRRLADGEKEGTLDLPRPYIFNVGRIAKAKGHDLLLAAYKRVLDRFPDVHLVIGGGSENPGGVEREVLSWIERFVEENGLQERVRLIGGVSNNDLPPYYRQSEMFILAGRYEPFGMTALEALACETPSIISKFAGIQRNLTSGGDCLLADPTETEELAEAVCTLLEDPDEAKRMARTGRKMIEREFSWTAIAARHLDLYRKHL